VTNRGTIRNLNDDIYMVVSELHSGELKMKPVGSEQGMKKSVAAVIKQIAFHRRLYGALLKPHCIVGCKVYHMSNPQWIEVDLENM
jgi:hypothetical protein